MSKAEYYRKYREVIIGFEEKLSSDFKFKTPFELQEQTIQLNKYSKDFKKTKKHFE